MTYFEKTVERDYLVMSDETRSCTCKYISVNVNAFDISC